MIYAIRAVGTKYIKVGKAKDVAKRLVTLETGCPYELSVEAIADWPDGAETMIHKLLAEHNVKNEWFVECDLLMAIIGWMRNKDLGLARLHHEARKLGLGSWVDAVKGQAEKTVGERIASAQMPKRKLTKAEKRRSERISWWANRG